jgi:hypothetical protein
LPQAFGLTGKEIGGSFASIALFGSWSKSHDRS